MCLRVSALKGIQMKEFRTVSCSCLACGRKAFQRKGANLKAVGIVQPPMGTGKTTQTKFTNFGLYRLNHQYTQAQTQTHAYTFLNYVSQTSNITV